MKSPTRVLTLPPLNLNRMHKDALQKACQEVPFCWLGEGLIRISYSLGWPETCYVAEDGRKLLICLCIGVLGLQAWASKPAL